MTEEVKPVHGEARMNRAEAAEPKGGHKGPAARGGMHHDAGPEKKVNMEGGLHGQPTEHSPLRHAVHELHEQHPIAHHDHGPHHGTTHHIRHQPLHGMKPSKGYGR